MSTPCLPGLLPGIIHAVGADLAPGPSGPAPVSVPQARRAVLVMCDGLGHYQLSNRLGHAPFLRKMLTQCPDPMRTVVPSTTSAALTALGTGLMPGATGVAGYSMRDPSGEIFNLIDWNGPTSPLSWQSQPTLAERLDRAGERLTVIQPKQYVGSGLTLSAWRGSRPVPAKSLDDRVARAVEESARGEKLVYLYWGDVDRAGHKYGWHSTRWIEELERFDAAMSQLARSLPTDTLLVITADHGMIDVTERIDITARDNLTRDVEVCAGEERALHLYTSEPEAVAARWRDYLGRRAEVYTREEIALSGLLGPLTAWAHSVIGDVMVFPLGTLGIGDSRTMSPGALSLRGLHGSITPQELDIPLLMEIM
ncbi:MAG: alkaline phosphatase family protein [Flaviflexus sp.]|nr:alkaline phosphatase family protein [Flaviflexus sp.]